MVPKKKRVMKVVNFLSKTALVLFICFTVHLVFHMRSWSCDIVVVSAYASANGRPFIWKNRVDKPAWFQKVKYKRSNRPEIGGNLRVAGMGLYSRSDVSSGGVNEAGFAIANTTVYEYDEPIEEVLNGNSLLSVAALRRCSSIKDFEAIIDSWHLRPLPTVIKGNFVVIDAFGGAALYEAFTQSLGGQVSYEKFDANTATDETGRFIGFVNRGNSNQWQQNKGEYREKRAYQMLLDLLSSERLTYRTVIQEIAKDVCGDIPKAEDLESFDCSRCISRPATNVAFVVDGVAKGGDPRLSTLWANLGEPSIGVCTPYFPYAKKVPPYARIPYSAMLDNLFDNRRLIIFFFTHPFNLDETCSLNLAIVNRELHLYRNNGYAQNLILAPAKTIGYRNLPEVQKWFMPLGNILFEKAEEYLSDMKANPDKTINYRKLLEVQEWSIPLENMLFEKAEGYLSDMKANPDLITRNNLYKLSSFSAKFAYENYVHQSAEHYTWDFDKPWGSLRKGTLKRSPCNNLP